MRSRRGRRLAAVATMLVVLPLAGRAAAQDLTGTWIPVELTADTLTQHPQNARVLTIRREGGGFVGRLVIPTQGGLPLAVEQSGDRVHLVISMARGMETVFDGTVTADRLTITPTGSQQQTVLRRPSDDERHALETLAPKKLPVPAMKVLPPNGLARTPPMGFSTWNHFQTKIDDATIRSVAAALVSTGMRDAGYVHVNIDDGWQGERDEHGEIHSNAKFPDMKALGDHLHSLGLKFGIYTSPGPKSCAGYEGSYGHEEQDARTFASWGVDYLKYDWCSAGLIYDDVEMPAVYLKMAEALRATGRPIVYSLCQYGRAEVWKWGPGIGGNLWRTTGDIVDRWTIMSSIGFSHDELSSFGGPGHWNDPDMLEVGNGHMTAAEYRTHMSLWAILAAPLIAGHDVGSSSPETIAILTNRDVIAIDQDPLGKPGRRVAQHGSLEVWTRTLDGARTAVGLFNRGDAPAKVEATLAELGVAGPVRGSDVWGQKTLGALADSVAADVEPHGVALLLLEPATAPAPSPSR